ncbi:hypothetical protein SODALDRAFT_361776 [Sodiomyces alkalinus F11]|uniref:Uncharacterized protein n=1 Tax=Sodiomyces alkalinus (strain CBS 110278 / VKM F-3762 / F11) TaxID=1314773 RepID=A0A3N2PR29_SODAK|nr:hypothetical protein SODALDRAFT_361776 [Sodiomyces alkalinus F11]ROT36938.1 hypothetical protein SODALDRAFT_361776 [Sodiomyces alkalinus F11]
MHKSGGGIGQLEFLRPDMEHFCFPYFSVFIYFTLVEGAIEGKAKAVGQVDICSIQENIRSSPVRSGHDVYDGSQSMALVNFRSCLNFVRFVSSPLCPIVDLGSPVHYVDRHKIRHGTAERRPGQLARSRPRPFRVAAGTYGGNSPHWSNGSYEYNMLNNMNCRIIEFTSYLRTRLRTDGGINDVLDRPGMIGTAGGDVDLAFSDLPVGVLSAAAPA